MTFPQDGADGSSRFENSIHSDGNRYSPSQFDGVDKPTPSTPKFEIPFRQDACGDGSHPDNSVALDRRSTTKLLRKLDQNLIPFIALLYL